MDNKQAQQQIRDIFQHPFQRARYLHFLRNLLNQIEPRDAHYTGNLIPDSFKDHVTQYWRVGKYIDPDDTEMDLLVVEVKSLSKLDRARSALRNFAVNRLKQFGKDCSLVAFYAKDDGGDDWRFSFVKIEHEAHQDVRGKIRLKTELTPAKRYSYLVGAHENSHTACQQLMPLLVMDYANPRIEEIEKAFSIEKVTDEFFEQYKGLYLKLSEQLKGQSFFLRGDAEENIQTVARFAKKLLGQIVFLYFLQKKGWLGAAKDDKWGYGSRRFMRDRFTQIAANEGNYYHDFLQYLFYEALAKERKDQIDPDYYERFSCKIPFLNGGLFEAEYDWQNHAIDLPNSLFHNDEKNKAGDFGTGILDVFDRYNFTIKEDEPLEKEVAVDPEMLGKVFENMLEITERKSKGAFYTPREIVHYMCQESLIHYLDNNLNRYAKAYQTIDSDQPILFGGLTDKKGQQKLEITLQDGIRVPKEDLETLIRKGHLFVENDEAALQALQRIESGEQKTTKHKIELPDSIKHYADKIDKYLGSIRVCDPAIGSGAFPVGLLHEIVNARLALAPHSGNSLSVYDLKRHTIHESLYGVDIEASAVDIARLRLWLSLIVDEDDFNADKALPNLDYKIVCGNSLIGFPEDWKSPAADKIEELKKEFFDEKDQEEKAKKKQQIEEEIQSRMSKSKQSFGYRVDFDFRLYFSEVWHEKDGFDVVIGNPPYLRIQGIRQTDPLVADAYKKNFMAATGSFDIYVLFMEKGTRLLNRLGVMNYIIPDKWVNASFGKGIRSLISKEQTAKRLLSFGAHQVFSACTYSSLVWIGRISLDNLQYAKLLPSDSNVASLQSEISALNDARFTQISYDVLSDNPWVLSDGHNALVMKKLINIPLVILDKLKIFVGLQTSKDSVYFLRNSVKLSEVIEADSPELGKRIKIESGFVKPLLMGDQVHRYQPIVTSNIVVFPYLIPKGGKATLMTEEFIKSEFPLGWSYIKECEEILRAREGSEFDNSCWYEFGRKQGIDFGDKEKILGPDISLGGNYSFDSAGEFYTTTTLYGYLKKDNVWESYKYWLAILNSSLLWFYLKNSGSVLANGYYRYKPAYLENFPVPTVTQNQESSLAILSSYLLTVKQFKVAKTLSKLIGSYLDNLVDSCVIELYFPNEIKTANKEILKHLGDLKPITDNMSDEEKLAVIQSEFDRLYDPRHPVRNNLETLDSVEEVRIIREALKR